MLSPQISKPLKAVPCADDVIDMDSCSKGSIFGIKRHGKFETVSHTKNETNNRKQSNENTAG